jgi:hypothetical protein
MPRPTKDRGDAFAGKPAPTGARQCCVNRMNVKVKAIDQTLQLQNRVQAQEQTSSHKNVWSAHLLQPHGLFSVKLACANVSGLVVSVALTTLGPR